VQENLLIDEKKLSELTGISVQTLRNWRHQRKGPNFLKISARLVRYRLKDVENFLEDHQVRIMEG